MGPQNPLGAGNGQAVAKYRRTRRQRPHDAQRASTTPKAESEMTNERTIRDKLTELLEDFFGTAWSEDDWAILEALVYWTIRREDFARWLLAESEWKNSGREPENWEWAKACYEEEIDIHEWLLAERDWALDQLAHDTPTADRWNYVETGAELLAYIRLLHLSCPGD